MLFVIVVKFPNYSLTARREKSLPGHSFGGETMTVKQLKKKLDAIPPKGPINLARRAAIIAMINELSGGR